MCELEMEQDASRKVLAVGHKVLFEGKEATITSIRVWHDLDTLLGPPQHAIPVFDLQGEGWHIMNVKIDEIGLWEPIQMPKAPIRTQ
ncbi:hypothetical protein ES703_30482 [subsurface metagenome]